MSLILGIINYFYRLLFIGVLLLVMALMACNQLQEESQPKIHDPGVLQRSMSELPSINMEISSETAHYKPMFGAGDDNSVIVKGIKRFGYLTIDPQGNSRMVNHGREELVYYVLQGTGVLHFEGQEIPVSNDDFFYVPIDSEHGFSNPRESSLNVIVMGYEIPEETEFELVSDLMIASANDVPWIVLGSHGDTVTYQLLMGTTESERDRLAAAYKVSSLFTMDFKPGGTNQPHRHRNQEEIYLVLQGHGDMVAGESPEGEELRYPVKAGDVFFFSKDTVVGFYSGTEEGEKNARILALRHNYPS